MKRLYIILLITSINFFTASNLYGQGCVAIRGFSGCGVGQGANLYQGDWLIGSNFRYFQSFRHFRGRHEEPNRIEEGTEVINNSYFLDLNVSYAFTDRLFVSAIIPFVYHNRSSMYEHGGNPPNGLGERHITYSKGLADIRFSGGYWILDPEKSHKRNFNLGIGIKLPTGDYNATSTFYNQGVDKNEEKEAVVDQSIQPGDGGFGYIFELQGFHMLSSKFMLTGNFFYLVNPQATNGVLTRNGRYEFSVPDQYGFRLGSNYIIPETGFSIYLGSRMEAVPSVDLIGSSEGYRRPGYAVSIEPGLNYSYKNILANLTVPIAVERNRTKSYLDKESGSHGDAAFADFLINFNLSYRVNKSVKVIKAFEKLENN
ncbi:MAG: transporter [Candidatus Cyclobacteriaceae bacterium M2_1C_046]